ncbi:MAG: 4-(cytidine 5'-diphospho)-2-C-methyl-D-erythritol kinase [Acidimicrobiales bacterium]
MLTAPAKLTRSLQITGVRDDGLHLIDAEMVAIDLVDDLEVSTAADGREQVVVVHAESGEPLDVGDPGQNLVHRALVAVGRRAQVTVRKRIPAGAGLGGGSADAAAVLRWAGWTGTRDQLAQAAELGADVAFCLVGGRARVTGMGEIVEPLPFVPLELTLVLPPFGCSTPAVYRMWDELGGPTGDGPNDLEPAALAVEPRLAEWRDRLGHTTGREPCLAGSGSTWFVEGAFPGPDRVVVRTIRAPG